MLQLLDANTSFRYNHEDIIKLKEKTQNVTTRASRKLYIYIYIHISQN